MWRRVIVQADRNPVSFADNGNICSWEGWRRLEMEENYFFEIDENVENDKVFTLIIYDIHLTKHQ